MKEAAIMNTMPPYQFWVLLVLFIATLLFGAMYGFLRIPVPQNGVRHGTGADLSLGGRYQFTVQGNQEFIFDTQTGRLWSRVGNGAANSWQQEASLPSSTP